MPLFKRNNNQPLIPPLQSSRNESSLASNAVRNRGSVENDRNELFSGYNPTKSGSGRFFDGGDIEEEEEDVEAIKQKTIFKKQESVKSTQTSIRLAQQAVDTGSNTLRRLEEQSERLANTEFHLDKAKGHATRAEDKTVELRKLNRSIFIPVLVLNNDAKHAARDLEVQRHYEEKRAGREKTKTDTRSRLAQNGREETGIPGSRRIRSTERNQFQFEANGSDDDMEDALESNLEEIEGLARKLKAIGTAMGGELDRQNGVLLALEEKTGKLDQRLHMDTAQLHRAGGR
ncbi:synaptosome-associated proteinsynaptosomal-associated protein 25 [Mycena alexandri]|uniref:Synaptosome-associated proteinsynaptosomal-associated protein 25 n=1 Tax=Mycena alexandri TaxID=1745969 RepID=A0AAD6TMT5_9AGAR|nr:synaptosome-associated proteinsynaptosomal-associated protein 25 [Mycena alexandri]